MGDRFEQPTKLTLADVQQIRSRYAAGELQKNLASIFGVPQPNISQIVNYRLWA